MPDLPQTLDYILGRLDSSTKPISEVAREAGVKASWLRMLKRRKIPNPGYQQVRQLIDYFEREAA